MKKVSSLLCRKPRPATATKTMLMMKLTAVLLLVTFLQVSAKSIGQTISISQKNTSLEKVFKEIHRKTGYQFFYQDELLKQANKFSIHVKDASIEQVLEICFRDQPLRFVITENTITVKRKEATKEADAPPPVPPIEVKGKVKDKNGHPLAGVTVSIVGAKGGVTTDENGNFTISVPENGLLSFSFVGFKTENIRVGKDNKILDISLTPEIAALTDVVIVGYGTQKKVSVVGAITSIGTAELRQSPTTNLSNALAGRMAGLMVNQFSGGEPGVDQSEVFIRGIATYNTGNSQKPLVMVDGIERDYQYLNPEEVETFSILKDASATAVYGVRGANGVILVTTRRGRIMDKPNVTFKAAAGLSSPVKFPEYLGSADYAALYNEARLNDNPATTAALFTPAQIENYRKAKGDNSDGLGYNIDLFDYAFKPSIQQDYNLNIQGGNKSVKYFMMAGYTNQDGNYKHTKLGPNNTNAIFKRYNFRSNIDINITQDFYARLNLGGRIQNRLAPGTTAARVVNIANTQPSIYPVILENNDNPANKTFIAKHPEGLLFGTQLYRYNILGELAYSGFINEYKTFMDGSFALGHKLDFITKGLTFEVQFSYDTESGNTVDRTIPHESEGYREYGGYATFYPKDGVDVLMNGGHYQGAYASPRRTENNTMNNGFDARTPQPQRKNNLQLTLNYARSFGLHNVTALLLGTRQRRTYQNDVPFGNQGIAFRTTYNYDDRYLLELNAGYNGSESFAKGRRYGLFPAVAAGWIISNESFMKKTTWIDYLKLRGSFGLVGSDQLPGERFGYLQFYNVNGDTYNFGTDLSGGVPANVFEAPLANPLLTWEKAKKANIGIEVRVLKNRLSFSADVFKEHRYDILTNLNNEYGSRNVSAVVGQSAPQLNLGIVDNKGFDLEIGWTDNIGKSFSYYIRPNISFARNKIVFINERDRIAPDGKSVSYVQRTGTRIKEQFVYVFDHFVADQAEADRLNAAVYQKWGKLIPGDVVYKDQNGDGQITDQEDRVAMGHPRNPELQFGIPMGVSYKGFDLSILFQGATNTSVQLTNAAAYDFPTYGQDIIGRVKNIHMNRWTPATAATATYPALHYGTHNNNKNPNSSLFLADGTYLRLKNLEVGYSIPITFLKKFGATKTRFYLQGLNLFTWDKLSDFDVDPETNTGGDWYPIQKVINFGVYVTF
ncbi:SusC/RagA family TonB-linked outer membrane protein [Paraflavitalea soli]|uniref:SusC/RagA family TonB-linked outer membrane protein n=1 Tax=Paraflavitalea soli TaxID=2315862 RepID=A0A3B7MYX2_9BACT|nr:TonB-dependent receptor [Paraflavitalea soli]AXY78419.1 SusC/RagA family TonB-linked outer membrane protein [Paraflavitalea soli]